LKELKRQVVIAGAGAAGLLAAHELSKMGLDCLVLEGKPEKKWGSRYCVDIDSGSILNGIVPTPKRTAIVHSGEGGGDLFSPSGRRGFNLSPLPLYTVKLWSYQKHLRTMTRAAGCELWFGSRLVSFSRETERQLVLRVDTREGEKRRIVCRLLVVATGNAFELDSQLYAHFGVRRRLLNTDYVEARQELWKLDQRKASAAALPSPPGAVSHTIGRFGPYSTLSVWVDSELKRAGLLAGTLTCEGYRSPARVLADYRRRTPIFLRRESGESGAIPIRRPVDMLVGDGVALVGQAACQVLPATGCGIALAAHAARLLAGPAQAYCLDRGDLRALWKYNHEYQATFGSTQASSEAFVRGIRRSDSSGSLIEQLLEAGLVEARDFLRTLELGSSLPSPLELPRKLVALVTRGRNVTQIGSVMARTVAVSAAYRSFYPKEPDFQKVRDFSARVEKLLGPR